MTSSLVFWPLASFQNQKLRVYEVKLHIAQILDDPGDRKICPTEIRFMGPGAGGEGPGRGPTLASSGAGPAPAPPPLARPHKTNFLGAYFTVPGIV